MANGTKTGGKDFVKGRSKTGGRQKIPPEIKDARKLSQVELERCINDYMYQHPSALKKLYESKELPALDMMIIKIITLAISKGDTVRMDFILNRVIGKVKEKTIHEFPNGGIQVVVADKRHLEV